VATAAARGSAGNVLAALASFFIPGLGQLLQGRPFKALFHVVLAGVIWAVSFTTLGWVMHLWSAFEAARWEPRS
jgi:TM2 domain-containing membrane protein YozV